MSMLLEHSTTTTDKATRAWDGPGPWVTGRMRLASTTAERRRGLRVRQVRPVKLLDATAARTVVGRTLDVSATGLRIELPNTDGPGLRIGEVFGIHVGLSQIGERLANRRHMIPVRVVWVARPAAGPTLAGLEFATAIGAQRDAA